MRRLIYWEGVPQNPLTRVNLLESGELNFPGTKYHA